jgi:hypothetical protein
LRTFYLEIWRLWSKISKQKSFLAFFGDSFFHCQVVKFFHKINKNAAAVFQIFSLFLGGVKKKKLSGEQKIMII